MQVKQNWWVQQFILPILIDFSSHKEQNISSYSDFSKLLLEALPYKLLSIFSELNSLNFC